VTKALCLIVLVVLSYSTQPAHAQDKEVARLQNSGKVLAEILNVPEDIPRDLLNKADCVIVLPSVVKFAMGLGASYGRGAMVCRAGDDLTGPWGAPSMVAVEGGSFGFQLGGQATDFVLLVMNSRGADSIVSSKVKLGAGVSAAAGPKGRDLSAATDAALRAEVLSYSRSRGLFAGISLEGSTLRPDNDANRRVYGRKISAREIVLHGKVAPPPAAEQMISVLQEKSPKNLSGK
jgi:lipid-binding SYLF domain-containing protein